VLLLVLPLPLLLLLLLLLQALSWFLEGDLIDDSTFSQGRHVPDEPH
jgi:hypothetical protein